MTTFKTVSPKIVSKQRIKSIISQTKNFGKDDTAGKRATKSKKRYAPNHHHGGPGLDISKKMSKMRIYAKVNR